MTPLTEKDGGTQGDHRVTALKFTLSKELNDAINAQKGDGKAVYRFDIYDGEGGKWSADTTELTGEVVSFELEERHTRYGGKITVYLVLSVLSNDQETEVELYSFPAVLRLKNLPSGVEKTGENTKAFLVLQKRLKPILKKQNSRQRSLELIQKLQCSQQKLLKLILKFHCSQQSRLQLLPKKR